MNASLVLVLLGLWLAVGTLVALLVGRAVRRGEQVPVAAPSPIHRPHQVRVPVESQVSERLASVETEAVGAETEHHLEPQLAVLLHGLLASTTLVADGLQVLRDNRHVLDAEAQEQLFEALLMQVGATQHALTDLLGEAEPELRAVLDGIVSAQLDNQAMIELSPELLHDGD